MRINSGPLARGSHFRLGESLFLHSGLNNIAVDQPQDVSVVALPLSLVHAASLAVDSPIEREQPIEIVPGHHVVAASDTIEKIHAGSTIALGRELSSLGVGAAASGSFFSLAKGGR